MASTRKLNVAVLIGGRSSEHDVSLQTGCMVCNALDRSKYEVKPVLIARHGKWFLPHGFLPAIPPLTVEALRIQSEALSHATTCNLQTGLLARGPEALLEGPDAIDVFFIALHGPYGEDGCMQGLFEILDVPYTGCGVRASSHALDKVLSKYIYLALGLKTPEYTVFRQPVGNAATDLDAEIGSAKRQVQARVGFPCVVKPATQGSSVGTSICGCVEAFAEAITQALRYFPVVLIERYIHGTEVTCGVLENPSTKELIPLPLIEIVPKESAFFDYHAKYTPGATDEICPARVSEEIAHRVQEMTLVACHALGVRGFSRADFILMDDDPYLLEINTIPGMAPTSLLPQAAKAAGIEFSVMLDWIVQAAINTHREKQRWQV